MDSNSASRVEIASIIVDRLRTNESALIDKWRQSDGLNHFILDDLLPAKIADAIFAAYPPPEKMKVKKSLRELKFVAAQMNKYNPILEEALYAFQDPRVVDLISNITGLKALEPDEFLYAGGISMMSKGHFLNPHIDNSHDKDRERYRVLNLLYYVTPAWKAQNGGNLELWPDGLKGPQITVESRFNRLAVMITNTNSWHSVSQVQVDTPRCCVSNYYFSKQPAEESEYFHVTSFRGRPEQKVRDAVLRADITLRTGIRKLFPRGVVKNKHFYDK